MEGPTRAALAVGPQRSAASDGDLELMQQLVENGVAVALGDYDARTAWHLARGLNPKP